MPSCGCPTWSVQWHRHPRTSPSTACTPETRRVVIPLHEPRSSHSNLFRLAVVIVSQHTLRPSTRYHMPDVRTWLTHNTWRDQRAQRRVRLQFRRRRLLTTADARRDSGMLRCTHQQPARHASARYASSAGSAHTSATRDARAAARSGRRATEQVLQRTCTTLPPNTANHALAVTMALHTAPRLATDSRRNQPSPPPPHSLLLHRCPVAGPELGCTHASNVWHKPTAKQPVPLPRTGHPATRRRGSARCAIPPPTASTPIHIRTATPRR
jgi:hypothetical protein